jgi:hypothetical protein
MILLPLFFALFSLPRSSLRQSTVGTGAPFADAEATPPSDIFLPIVSGNESNENSSVELSNSITSTPSDETQTDEVANPDEPEPFNIVPVQPVPIPSFDPVSPELDSIKFEIVSQLDFPKGDSPFFGNISWSPEHSQFVGEYANVFDGEYVNQIYIGDIQTAKISLWRENASYPVWSRDGKSIIYLKQRIEEPLVVLESGWSRSHYDLVNGFIDEAKDEVLLRDVIPPYRPIQQHAQTNKENLLALNNLHRLVLFPTLNELSEITKQDVQPAPITDISQVVGISVDSQEQMLNEADPAFLIDPTGERVIVMSANQPAYIVNLADNKLEGQIEKIDTPHNVAWSGDGKSIAYTTPQGLFVYESDTKATTNLISKKDLGFNVDGMQGGFSTPSWAFDDQVILFMVASSDWVKSGTEDRLESYTLATTKDGRFWKAISDADLISISPSGSYAVVRSSSDSTGVIFELINLTR